MGIAQRRAQHAALAADALVLDVDPGEEGVGVRAQVQLAERADLLGRLAAPRPLEVEDALDAQRWMRRTPSRATGSLLVIAILLLQRERDGAG
jgi:hypothetical protein